MPNKMNVSSDVKINISHIGSDLRVRGWNREEVRATGDSIRISSSEDNKTVTIFAPDDCELSIPIGASLNIDHIGSDAKITEIHGPVKINTVGSDLQLRDTGAIEINSVGNDLHIRQADGAVKLNHIGNDLTINEVTQDVHVEHVGSDAYLREVNGSCICDFVGGDLILQLQFTPEHEYSASSGGDLVCRVADGSNVRFEITANGDIDVDAANAESHGDDEHEQTVKFGEGAAVARLESNGDVRIVDDSGFSFDFEADLDGSFDVDIDRIMQQTHHMAERARAQAERIREQVTREAERVADEFRRQAERAADDARREMGRQGRGKRGNPWNWSDQRGNRFGFPTPPVPPVPPVPPMSPMGFKKSEPVTNEERLTILKMVEAKQISVEEAERLLAALEGRT